MVKPVRRLTHWLQGLEDPSHATVVPTLLFGIIVGLGSVAAVFAPWQYGVQILLSTSAVALLLSGSRNLGVTSRSVARIAGDRKSVNELFVPLEDVRPTLKSRLANAKEVWVCGPTLAGLTVEFRRDIERALNEGTRFRFIVGSSDERVAEAFTDYFTPAYTMDPAKWEGKVDDGINTLIALRRETDGAIEARMVKHFIAHNLVITDPNTGLTTVQVHLNVCGLKTEAAPALCFSHAESARLSRMLCAEFEEMWEQRHSDPIDLT